MVVGGGGSSSGGLLPSSNKLIRQYVPTNGWMDHDVVVLVIDGSNL